MHGKMDVGLVRQKGSHLANVVRDGKASSGAPRADVTSVRNSAGSRTPKDAGIAAAKGPNYPKGSVTRMETQPHPAQ